MKCPHCLGEVNESEFGLNTLKRIEREDSTIFVCPKCKTILGFAPPMRAPTKKK